MTVCAPPTVDRMLTALDNVPCYRHASKPSERVRIVQDCVACLRGGITLVDYCEALETYKTAAEYLTDHCPQTTLNVCPNVDLSKPIGTSSTNPSALPLTPDTASGLLPSQTMYHGRDNHNRPTSVLTLIGETTMTTQQTTDLPLGYSITSEGGIMRGSTWYRVWIGGEKTEDVYVTMRDARQACFDAAGEKVAPAPTSPTKMPVAKVATAPTSATKVAHPVTPVAAPAPVVKQIEIEEAPVKVKPAVQPSPVKPVGTSSTKASKITLPQTFKQCVSLGSDGVVALAAQIGCTLPNLSGKGAHVKLASALWAHLNSTQTHIPTPAPVVQPVKVNPSTPPVRQLRGGTGREVLPLPKVTAAPTSATMPVVAPVVTATHWHCVDASRPRYERTIDGVCYAVRPIKGGSRWLAFADKDLIESNNSDKQTAQLFCESYAHEMRERTHYDDIDQTDTLDEETVDDGQSATVQVAPAVKVPIAEVTSAANTADRIRTASNGTMSNGHISAPPAVTQTVSNVVESVSASAYKAIAGLLTGAALSMRAMGHSEANGELGACLSDIERIAGILSVRSHGAKPLERAHYAPVGTSAPVCQLPEVKPIKPAVVPVKHEAKQSPAQHTPLTASLRAVQAQQQAPVIESDDEPSDTVEETAIKDAIKAGTLGALRKACDMAPGIECDKRSTRSMTNALSAWLDAQQLPDESDDDEYEDDGEESKADDDSSSENDDNTTADDMLADDDTDSPIVYKSGDRVEIISNDDKGLIGKSGTVYKMTDGNGIKIKDAKGRVITAPGTDDGIPGVYVRVDGEKSATFFMVGEVVSSDVQYVPASQQKGHKYTHDCPWTPVKARVYQIMQQRGATNETNAIRTVVIARILEKEGWFAHLSNPKAIRFQCERAARKTLKHGCADDTQYVRETSALGEKGIFFYLTAKGQKMNPVAELEKAKARAGK